MAEENTIMNENSSTENSATESTQKEIHSLKDIIPNGAYDFDAIVDEKFISSKEFCSNVSAVFKEIFADYEGCTFNVIPNSNQPNIELYFNHRDFSTSNLPLALTKDIQVDHTRNHVLAQLRERQARLNNGDKYFLTDFAQGLLKDVLIGGSYIFKKDQSVKWDKVVVEVADPQARFMPNAESYTKVGFVDPTLIASLLYGDKVNGSNYEYNVRVMRSLPNFNMGGNTTADNFILAVERISEEETKRLASMYGFSFSSGLNIIRAL